MMCFDFGCKSGEQNFKDSWGFIVGIWLKTEKSHNHNVFNGNGLMVTEESYVDYGIIAEDGCLWKLTQE